MLCVLPTRRLTRVLGRAQTGLCALPIERSAIVAFPAQAQRGDPPHADESFRYRGSRVCPPPRPTYPDELFAFLATLVPSRDVAWDCATGNGQAATHLAGYFERVVATDESGEMIAQATPDPRITYRVAEAEDSGLEDRSVVLVTVASAIHWFNLGRFYAEVNRVVKPGGTIAAWTYYTPVFGGAIDAVIQRLVHD